MARMTQCKICGAQIAKGAKVCPYCGKKRRGAGRIVVSSMLSFSAYVDGYATSLDLGAIASSDKSQLDGSVAPGKKMNGIVGYSVDQRWTEVEVRFTPDFWSGREIVFSYSK